jgi:hypothetical protein
VSEISGCPRVGCSGKGRPSIRFPGGAWGSRRLHFVECQSCFVRGPAFDDSRERAIIEWNTLPRHIPTKQEECPERSQEQVEPVVNACPMCGEYPDVRVDLGRDTVSGNYQVICKCGVRGSVGKDKQEAIEYWNMLSSEGNRWISIKEGLPETNVYVLVCVTGKSRPLIGQLIRSEGIWNVHRLWDVQPAVGKWFQTWDSVTHWQPLPNLPKPVQHDSTSGWISVEDRLPIPRWPVLACDGIGRICIAQMIPATVGSSTLIWIYSLDGNRITFRVRHWRLLPNIPIGEE